MTPSTTALGAAKSSRPVTTTANNEPTCGSDSWESCHQTKKTPAHDQNTAAERTYTCSCGDASEEGDSAPNAPRGFVFDVDSKEITAVFANERSGPGSTTRLIDADNRSTAMTNGDADGGASGAGLTFFCF